MDQLVRLGVLYIVVANLGCSAFAIGTSKDHPMHTRLYLLVFAFIFGFIIMPVACFYATRDLWRFKN